MVMSTGYKPSCQNQAATRKTLTVREYRKQSIVVEYALRDITKPIGVSTYRVTLQLPEPLRNEIPLIEDLQSVIEKLRDDFDERKGKAQTPQIGWHPE